MPLSLWLLVACRPAVDTDSDSPASTPVPTFDTDVTDTDAEDPENWDFHVTPLEGYGGPIAILQTTPEILVALVRAGEITQDGVRPASGAVYHLDTTLQALELRAELPHPLDGVMMHMTVEALGDVTQDGEPDLGVRSDRGHVLTGPFDAGHVPTAIEVPGTPYPCDADSSPPIDLCLGSGIDLGPFDSQLDVEWNVGVNLGSATYSPTSVYFLLYLNWNFPRIAHVALNLTGTVDVDTQPTWEPTGLQVSEFTVLDTHADGSEHLLVCGTQNDVPGLRLLDAFPADSPVRMTLDATCDALEVADFTGDGLPEVAVGTGSRVRIVDPRTWTVLAEHEGTFQPAPPLQDGYGRAMDSADLNGDGRMDLIIGAPGVGRIYVLTEVVPQGVAP